MLTSVSQRLTVIVGSCVIALVLGLQPVAASSVPNPFHPVRCSGDAQFQAMSSWRQFSPVNDLFFPAAEAACAYGSLNTSYNDPFDFPTANLLKRNVLLAGIDYTPAPDMVARVAAGSGTDASPVLQIPIFVAGVAVIYDLPCWGGHPLNLSSPVIAKIYDGVITHWDDRTIEIDNPGISAACSGATIALFGRADRSEVTTVFKDYLSKRNPEYQPLRQDALNQNWLADTAGNRLIRVTDSYHMRTGVSSTANSIGYNYYSYVATRTSPTLQIARVDNPSHSFTAPAPGLCTTAATTGVLPDSAVGSWQGNGFTDSAIGYPICAFSWNLVFEYPSHAAPSLATTATVQALVDYLSVVLDPATQARLSGLAQLGNDPLPLATETFAQQEIALIN